MERFWLVDMSYEDELIDLVLKNNISVTLILVYKTLNSYSWEVILDSPTDDPTIFSGINLVFNMPSSSHMKYAYASSILSKLKEEHPDSVFIKIADLAAKSNPHRSKLFF